MTALSAVRADFPIFQTEAARHFLDSAASSQKPRQVLDVMAALAGRGLAIDVST